MQNGLPQGGGDGDPCIDKHRMEGTGGRPVPRGSDGGYRGETGPGYLREAEVHREPFPEPPLYGREVPDHIGARLGWGLTMGTEGKGGPATPRGGPAPLSLYCGAVRGRCVGQKEGRGRPRAGAAPPPTYAALFAGGE